jgi:hypothetical protein
MLARPLTASYGRLRTKAKSTLWETMMCDHPSRALRPTCLAMFYHLLRMSIRPKTARTEHPQHIWIMLTPIQHRTTQLVWV